jgi:hypothetical protein
VYANVGKAIFFSAVTTMGAFAFFVPIRNVAMSRTMIATLVAIGVIFVVTVIVTALAYRVKAPAGEPESRDKPAPETNRLPGSTVPSTTAAMGTPAADETTSRSWSATASGPEGRSRPPPL